MASHDAPTGGVSLVQIGISIITGVFGTVAAWLALRGKKAELGSTEKQAELSQEQRILETAVEERKETVRDLREYIERLEKRIEGLEKKRDENEAAVDRMRRERDLANHDKNSALMVVRAREETIRLQAMELARYQDMDERVGRLEQQVVQLGGKPVNGHA